MNSKVMALAVAVEQRREHRMRQRGRKERRVAGERRGDFGLRRLRRRAGLGKLAVALDARRAGAAGGVAVDPFRREDPLAQFGRRLWRQHLGNGQQHRLAPKG